MERVIIDKRSFFITVFELLLKRFGPQHWWPGDSLFEIMVGAILTQNTAWSNVEKAIANLKAFKVLNPHTMYALSREELASLIRPSGFYNQKEQRLRDFLRLLVEEFSGDPEEMAKASGPWLRNKLLKISGIGPETADSILLYALEKPFFVVDAYTKRVLERMGVVEGGLGYHPIQRLFMNHLPGDVALFNEYHALFVELGKVFCKKKAPQCSMCPLSPFCSYGVEA